MLELGHDVGNFGPMAQAWAEQGKAPVFMAVNHKVAPVFAIFDGIKPEAKGIVTQLQKRGIAVAMVTGDTNQTAQHVAQELGIVNIASQATPARKQTALANMQGPVAFVGDGINDAPALAKTDVASRLAQAPTLRLTSQML
jgi:P-type E1-E2 ATPase